MPRALAFLRSSAWAALLGLLGCSRPGPRYAEHVTDAGQGHFWAAGSEGYAVFFDGTTLHRRDYPRARGARDSAYEHAIIPAARVVLRRDEPYLFTRNGEVHRWSGSGWAPLPVRLVAHDTPDVQVDEVLLTPDDGWLIYLHGHTLLWASHEAFLESRFEVEPTPSYCTWMGLIDGKLYGLGWDGTGNRRAVLRRDGPSRWHTAVLPTTEAHGVLRTPRHEIAALGDEGQLIVVEREGEDITPQPRPTLPKGSFFLGVTRTRSGGSLLRVIGNASGGGLLELGTSAHTLWSFPTGLIAGAFETPHGPGALLESGEIRSSTGRSSLSAGVSEVAGP